MFPLILVALGIGAWFLLNYEPEKEPKQLGPGGSPVPLAALSGDDLGLLLTYHAAMYSPSSFSREQLGEIVNALHAQGFTFEGADLTARANGQQYPTEVLIYHDMLTRANEYTPDAIAANAEALDAIGGPGEIYAEDLGVILEGLQ